MYEAVSYEQVKEEFDVEDVVGDERLALLIPRNATTRSIKAIYIKALLKLH